MAKKPTTTQSDILIIGAGPAGLCLARALADSGLRITLVEKAPLESLRNPRLDGRDIALTHLSRTLMIQLGLWDLIPANEINPLCEARVINGTSPYYLQFHQPAAPEEALGFFVPNNLIRKAAFDSLKGYRNITLLAATEVKQVETGDTHGTVTLADGRTLTAPLVVAADSRFSTSREQMGIAIERKDFGRSVIVGRMKHENHHRDIAYECFIDEQTLAVLPLAGGKSCSFVITLPTEVADEMMQMSRKEFSRIITERFQHRVGKMELIGERHPYPLVGVYAKSFHAQRYVLVGDAAVGMHPVTAHGFNFGLRGAVDLAQRIIAAHEAGQDIGNQLLLASYTRQHRRVTRPLYLATNALVALYTNDTAPAQLLRNGLLKLGNKLAPVNKLLMNRLTELPASLKYA